MTQQSAQRIAARARQLVPKDTHETEEHIEVVKGGPFTFHVISTRPSTDAEFDVPTYLETKVQPYLRPALEEEREPYLAALVGILDGLV